MDVCAHFDMRVSGLLVGAFDGNDSLVKMIKVPILKKGAQDTGTDKIKEKEKGNQKERISPKRECACPLPESNWRPYHEPRYSVVKLEY